MVSIIGNFFFGRDAAGWFVEQQQLGRGGERHRDVEQFAHAARQLGDAALAVFGEAETFEQRVGARQRLVSPRRLPEAQALVVAGVGDEHVVEHRQVAVELRDLE